MTNAVGYGVCACGCGGAVAPARKTDRKQGTIAGQPARFLRGHNRRNGPVPAEVQERTGICDCGCGQPTQTATSTNAARGQYAGYPGLRLKGHKSTPRKTWVGVGGYVYLSATGHPNANAAGVIAEHRHVMSKMLGRALAPGESVHHINGDRRDNRPENLQLRQGAHGPGVVLACNNCGSHDVAPRPITST